MFLFIEIIIWRKYCLIGGLFSFSVVINEDLNSFCLVLPSKVTKNVASCSLGLATTLNKQEKFQSRRDLVLGRTPFSNKHAVRTYYRP